MRPLFRPGAPGLCAALLGLIAGCATVRSGSSDRGGEPLDRAALARCAYAAAPIPDRDALLRLAGEWTLTLGAEGADPVSGWLELRVPDGDAPAGDAAAPLLVGATGAPFADVGAVVPGPADSRDAAAPGVGLYAFDPGAEEAGTPRLAAVLRIGSESNRRDRQRFDGAHTTLRLGGASDDGFGGTWTSAEGAAGAEGTFCAVRR